MKEYTKPNISVAQPNPGLPTVIAVAAVSALAGASAVAVSKLVGDDRGMYKNKTLMNVKDD